MAVMAVAPSGELWWGAMLATLAFAERSAPKPRRAARRAAAALTVLAGVAALVA